LPATQGQRSKDRVAYRWLRSLNLYFNGHKCLNRQRHHSTQ
jgi:hypothetical protein